MSREIPGQGAGSPAALVLMDAGREERAREIAGDLGKRVQDVHQAYAKLIGGYLSLNRGDTANAVRCFAEALSEFEKCERRKGEALSVFLNDLPTVRYLDALDYYVGRAQEGLGKAAVAKDAYQRFLKIKAKADPGQALVEDAKKRLALFS